MTIHTASADVVSCNVCGTCRDATPRPLHCASVLMPAWSCKCEPACEFACIAEVHKLQAAVDPLALVSERAHSLQPMRDCAVLFHEGLFIGKVARITISASNGVPFTCQSVSLQKRPERCLLYLFWYEEIDGTDVAYAPHSDSSTLLPTFRLCPPDSNPGVPFFNTVVALTGQCVHGHGRDTLVYVGVCSLS